MSPFHLYVLTLFLVNFFVDNLTVIAGRYGALILRSMVQAFQPVLGSPNKFE